MQDKIILGILQYRDMTSYDVKKTIEGSTAYFYNASMGSIHPALKKLEASQCVTVSKTVENGRAKKVYQITDKGKEVFSDWQSQGIPMPKFREETLVRLFFFGRLEEAEQNAYLHNHIAELDAQIVAMEVVKKQMLEAEFPSDFDNHAKFQFATLDYGLQYCRFSRDWYQSLFEGNTTDHKGP